MGGAVLSLTRGTRKQANHTNQYEFLPAARALIAAVAH
jgi:hypothetical protein